MGLGGWEGGWPVTRLKPKELCIERGTTGEYGDIRLTSGLHLQMAREIKKLAGKICSGRLVVVLCGGNRRGLASSLIPRILDMLTDK